jgi:hypothetical protein
MKLPSTFQRDLFGPDASLFGWPSDGQEQPGAPPGAKGEPPSADLRTGSKMSSAVRVALDEALGHPAAENACADGAQPHERSADRDAAPG